MISQPDVEVQASKKAKLEFGEVRTPTQLVNNILDLFPISIYTDINKRWLDVGAGTGQFSIELFKRLDRHLSGIILEKSKRHHHILTKMMYMIEIQPTLVKKLKHSFLLLILSLVYIVLVFLPSTQLVVLNHLTDKNLYNHHQQNPL